MDINFNNKLILITGSTQGIGFAIGNALLNLGATVIFNSRTNNLKQLKTLKQTRYKHIVADVSYYLYQKTAPTTDAGTDSNILLKKGDEGQPNEMTTANLQTLVPAFRNRIIAGGVGKYLLQTGSPSATGTWVQMGSTMTDQLKDIASANYAGDYTGSYTGYYDRFFSGFLNGAYAGSYSGTYTGYYAGNTVQSSSSTQETKQLFIRTA